MNSFKHERGAALVIALLAVLILSALSASVIFSTQTEIWTSYNYRLLTQSRYAAEAGLQRTAFWMRNSYAQPTVFNNFNMTTSPVQYSGSAIVLSALNGISGNYPDGNVQTAFNTALNSQAVPGMGVTATYSVSATLQSMKVVQGVGSVSFPIQVWNVTSRGEAQSGQKAQVEVEAKLENIARPTFNYAAFGISPVCGSVTIAGNATTDSYDSALGSYTATHTNSGGNVGSNGNVLVQGTSTVVNGTSSTPNPGTGNCSNGSLTGLQLTGGATVAGGPKVLPVPLSFPNPPAPSPLPPTTNQTIVGNNNLCSNFVTGCTVIGANNVRLSPGGYGNISAGSGNVIHFTAGTYNVNSLDLTGGSQIVIDSGPVILNLAGQSLNGNEPVMDLSGGAVISNSLSSAKDFQILYSGTRDIELSGGTATYGVVYAPNANVVLNGGSNWYGSILSNTVDDHGGVSIHYDRSLDDDFYIPGAYRPVSFSWKKY
jgi:Tfp pilus assembly protein PilX